MQNFKKKLLEILKKLNTPLAYAILLAIAGLLLIILPEEVLEVFFIVAGILVSAFAVSRLVVDSADKNHSFGYTLRIIFDAALIALGFSLIFLRTALVAMLARSLGFVMAGWAIYRIYLLSKVDSRGQGWGLRLASAIVFLVCGIALLAYPIYPNIMVGVALILISAMFFTKIKKFEIKDDEVPGKDGVYYTDDFVDKSDK